MDTSITTKLNRVKNKVIQDLHAKEYSIEEEDYIVNKIKVIEKELEELLEYTKIKGKLRK